MEKSSRIKAPVFALLAAVFYAISTPFSKLLMTCCEPTFMAAFLYLGAGIGVGIMYIFHIGKEDKTERLTKTDLPYTAGMIVLDIAAPVFLMLGINIGSASNSSLLGNFEIVATALIALLLFKEKVSRKLWIAIGLITASSAVLSFEGIGSFKFSYGSLLVILATCCWGLENNCTRKISEKSTYEIVTLKGLCSGTGSFIVALFVGEKIPSIKYITYTLLLGFVAYGLSIFLYVRAQRDLGAAKTSAYYAVAPFVGAFLAFIVNGEELTVLYFAGLILMLIGSALVVSDTIAKNHSHGHVVSDDEHRHSRDDHMNGKEHGSARTGCRSS